MIPRDPWIIPIILIWDHHDQIRMIQGSRQDVSPTVLDKPNANGGRLSPYRGHGSATKRAMVSFGRKALQARLKQTLWR